MILPTIYKRTSTGAVQIWFAEVEGDQYRTTSGQLDGKKTTTDWTTCEAKNVGKSNEVSPEAQAVIETDAMYQHKLARDYHPTMDTIDEPMRFKPMLAHKWKDRRDKITDRYIYIQPKLDGMRCIVNSAGMWSREGKPILAAPHILEDLAWLFEENPDLVFDGELYNHDYKDDFNTIISAAKKKNPTAESLEKSREMIQYWVYDLPSHSGTFRERWSEYTRLLCRVTDAKYCRVVETIAVPFGEIEEMAMIYIGEGFEGAMIRQDRVYENKRSNYLVKWKEMQDEEFELVDVLPGTGNHAQVAASVVCKLPDGRTFSAGMRGNRAFCREFLETKAENIGKLVTIIFQNYTPDGVPRFGKFKAVRDYE